MSLRYGAVRWLSSIVGVHMHVDVECFLDCLFLEMSCRVVSCHVMSCHVMVPIRDRWIVMAGQMCGVFS